MGRTSHDAGGNFFVGVAREAIGQSARFVDIRCWGRTRHFPAEPVCRRKP